ncbi:Tim44/TimA family putative adaptor protein [Magnetospira thiophila]
MDGGFQFFDIILFALVAGFLVFRLRNVLGRRDGHEGGYQDPYQPKPDNGAEPRENDNVIPLPDRTERSPLDEDLADANPDDPLTAGLLQIRIADPTFEERSFLSGAKGAFEMIVGSFAAGDRAALAFLLSPEVLANFEKVITQRETNEETVEHELVGLRQPEFMEAEMQGDTARITVKFVSEQVNVVRDKDGKVVEGDPNYVDKVTDFWTFARDVRATDPNWSLVATRSLDS